MSERIPERLVRIEYEIPPMRAIRSTYFADTPEFDGEYYQRALEQLHPGAKIRSIVRDVKPVPDCGKGGC